MVAASDHKQACTGTVEETNEFTREQNLELRSRDVQESVHSDEEERFAREAERAEWTGQRGGDTSNLMYRAVSIHQARDVSPVVSYTGPVSMCVASDTSKT